MLTHVVLMLMAVVVFVPADVNANHSDGNDPSRGIVYIADSVHTGDWGFFSTSFIGLRLNSANLAVVVFRAGDWAVGEYVVSTDMRVQTESFFENEVEMRFLSAGTWWYYIAIVGSTINWDYIQVRIVPHDWEGEITPKFVNPPFNWREGYPPYGVPFNSDGTAGTDGAVATLPSPTFTTIPSRHHVSKSITVWLAPLLVGIIMIAITVPIVIFAYKKGKQNAKNAQIQVEPEAAIQAQQQTDQANSIQV